MDVNTEIWKILPNGRMARLCDACSFKRTDEIQSYTKYYRSHCMLTGDALIATMSGDNRYPIPESCTLNNAIIEDSTDGNTI